MMVRTLFFLETGLTEKLIFLICVLNNETFAVTTHKFGPQINFQFNSIQFESIQIELKNSTSKLQTAHFLAVLDTF